MKKEPWTPGNALLSGLAPDTCERLRDEMTLVDLPVGRILFQPDVPQTHVYFPRSGVVSLLAVLENGDTGEVAMVGNEGVVGVSLLVEQSTTPTRAIVQVAGEALVMRADQASAEFRRGGDFQRAMLRYVHALITQIAQVSMCTRRVVSCPSGA